MNSYPYTEAMKSKCAAVMVVIVVLAMVFVITRKQHGKVRTVEAQAEAEAEARAEAKPIPQEIPPLPADVTELKFTEFFVSPIGNRGLSFTEKLRSLDGKRVRILGYMVRQEQPIPGTLLLTSLPVQSNEEHDGLADDIPAAAVYVSVPSAHGQIIPHTPQPMLLTGTLSVGNREEADGRISTVRLASEASPSARRSAQLPRGTK